MMQRALAFVAFAALLALAVRAEAMETVVNVSNVGLYVGHRVTFCGTISQTKQAGKAFFINFGGHYPQHRFTNVIFKSDQSRFNLADFAPGQNLCTTGTVKEYKGVPEIVLTSPSQVVE
ncbi:MAG: hypothetical protein K6C33_04190 [Desulfovibrio sp.]|jgi:hypothetical protein|nr:hypothetical protein [Desulfovibrio sp.]